MQQTASSAATWSKPYCGLTHLSGLRDGFQVTVQDYVAFAECIVFVPGRGFSANKTQHITVEAAKAHGESQAQQLRACAGGT